MSKDEHLHAEKYIAFLIRSTDKLLTILYMRKIFGTAYTKKAFSYFIRDKQSFMFYNDPLLSMEPAFLNTFMVYI